ncbi:MAG: hypothetical protein CSA07_00840 [Bacteroidia bacterium]|nr:MAG: hypothetical protein CSA07_00840 [Bacteroidia bacterium]
MLVLGASAFAQGDYPRLERRIASSDGDIAKPKYAAREKTWRKRGELMMEAYEAPLQGLGMGVGTREFSAAIGEPEERKALHIHGGDYVLWSTAKTDFYFSRKADGTEDKLDFYRVKKAVLPSPLDSAMRAYGRAASLSQEGVKDKRIAQGYEAIRRASIASGINASKQLDYKGAVGHFARALAVDSITGRAQVDSTLSYYTGIMLLKDKQYAPAMGYLEKAINAGYTNKGQVYCLYFEAAELCGQGAKGKQMLMRGVGLFPEAQCVLMQLVEYNIKHKEDSQGVIELIDRALAKSPKNASLYFAKGIVYDELGDMKASEAAYQQAVAIVPNYPDAYYNMAVLHYNHAVDLSDQAAKLPSSDTKGYDKLQAEAQAEYRKCIPLAEKVCELIPGHGNSLNLLKKLYFRFRAEKGMMEKYEKVKKMLEGGVAPGE